MLYIATWRSYLAGFSLLNNWLVSMWSMVYTFNIQQQSHPCHRGVCYTELLNVQERNPHMPTW